MRKKINLYMFFIVLFSVFLVTISITSILYNDYKTHVRDNLEEKTKFYKTVLLASDDPYTYIDNLDFSDISDRITIVNIDGTVLFDNFVEDVTSMESHKDRPEIIDAFENGYGKDSRRSTTISKQTYYYAVKLNDNTVLRVSVGADNIYSTLYESIPGIIISSLLIFVACYFLARVLTKSLLKPINEINFDDVEDIEYDELEPLLNTIKMQKHNMYLQMREIEERSDTISYILKSMSEGLIIVNTDSKIIAINDSALNMFGKEESSFNDKMFNEFIRDIEVLKALEKSLGGERIVLQHTYGEMVFEMHLNPAYTNEEITGIVILFIDVTTKASAEKIRREFSANVSHELKTPLTTILGFSEMIGSGMIPENEVKNFNNKIKDEATTLLKLIEDIMLVSELDEQKTSEYLEKVNLKTVIEDVVERLKIIAENKNVTIEVDACDVYKNTNRRMIVEMIYNLMSNAIKYNKENGKVVVRLLKENDKVTLTVEDTGIGIPLIHQDRIFERFYCVDKSRSKKTGGTGLGLSIVKNIVNYFEGTIEVESKEDSGTKFTVSI